MLVPGYGGGSLADLPDALLAALGVGAPDPDPASPPGAADASDPASPPGAAGGGPLVLEPADRVCLFLVDGLGAELLRAHAEAAPFLSGLAGRTLTAGFPA